MMAMVVKTTVKLTVVENGDDGGDEDGGDGGDEDGGWMSEDVEKDFERSMLN